MRPLCETFGSRISTGNVVFLIILLCAALQCTIEHHMLEIAYNPFLLAVFAKIAEPQTEGKMMKGRT